MHKILKELYYGNIHPCDGILPKEEEYRKAIKQALSIEAALLSTLDATGHELYNQLEFANAACDSIESAYIYADGFRTGANIMLACVVQEDA